MNGWYAWLSLIVGVVTWLGTFAASWLIMSANYGFWAVLLGWIPACVIAGLAAIVMAAAWPLVALWALWYWRLPLFGA